MPIDRATLIQNAEAKLPKNDKQASKAFKEWAMKLPQTKKQLKLKIAAEHKKGALAAKPGKRDKKLSSRIHAEALKYLAENVDSVAEVSGSASGNTMPICQNYDWLLKASRKAQQK